MTRKVALMKTFGTILSLVSMLCLLSCAHDQERATVGSPGRPIAPSGNDLSAGNPDAGQVAKPTSSVQEAEEWMGKPLEITTQDPFFAASDWEGFVEILAGASERREPLVWKAHYEEGNDAGLEYCVATYLMAKNSDCLLFEACPRNGGKGESGDEAAAAKQEYASHRELFGASIGEPLGPRQSVGVQGGMIWQRPFSRGLVFCNPSKSDTYTITLAESMRRVGRGTVKTVTLRPREAAILVAGV
jgi:hypothetical protein